MRRPAAGTFTPPKTSLIMFRHPHAIAQLFVRVHWADIVCSTSNVVGFIAAAAGGGVVVRTAVGVLGVVVIVFITRVYVVVSVDLWPHMALAQARLCTACVQYNLRLVKPYTCTAVFSRVDTLKLNEFVLLYANVSPQRASVFRAAICRTLRESGVRFFGRYCRC